MSIENYAGQSIVDTPKKKEGTPEKSGRRLHKAEERKKTSETKRERIAVVNGKLTVVQK
jgi:hypothetical protein